MPITTIFFDLDDTLYPASSGVWKMIKARMTVYMHDRIGIPWEDIPTLREKYFSEYGTTLRGLQAHYPVDMDDYLSFVHDIPLEEHLRPDEKLRAMLEALPAHKLIFTNADSGHALRTVTALGVQSCFEAIVDIRAMDPYCKPMRQAFEIAMRVAGEQDPHRCVLVDDLASTTRAAQDFGFYSILFGQDGNHAKNESNARLSQLMDLPAVLKGL
jgi:pyrimidine 5'-nucleotidase